MGNSSWGQKKKLKKYLAVKTGYLLFSVALLLSACEKERENDAGKRQQTGAENNRKDGVENLFAESLILGGIQTVNGREKQEVVGLENIAPYLAPEKISESGRTRLQEMEEGYKQMGEGSLILNGFTEEEGAVAERIQNASGRIACWMIYRDFDGDGKKEAFVYACDLVSGRGTELWFAAANGTVQRLLEGNTYRTQSSLELPGKTFYLYTVEGKYAKGFFMYEVEKNTAKPAQLQGVKYLGDRKFVADCPGCNAFSLEAGGDAGSCWRNYYYYYDESGFHEYSGVLITEEEFCQYENGSEILSEVKKCGTVEEIYYFADGRIIINYVEDDVILDELYGGMVRRNHYLQVPILSEGEDGFVLAANDFLDIRSMQQGQPETDRGEHDLFVGDGNYLPFFQEGLAQYPNYQSPLEYWRERYSGMAKDPERILTAGAMNEMGM